MQDKPHLTHVALWSADLDRSVAFYRKHCGLDVVHERGGADGGRVVWVGENPHRPRFVIVLIERRAATGPPGSFAHFGFSCATRADVDRHADTARAEGILELEPHDAGPVVGYYCIVRDPDGNSVEFSYGQTIDPGHFGVRRPSKS
jgi:catechol 2,3-dioxygenase-like lactoylglutathione lyase family enzyme